MHLPRWAFFLALSCTVSSLQAQSPEKQIRQFVDSIYAAKPDAVGFTLHVEAPDQHLSWSYAVGYGDRNTRQLLAANQPVLMASNTKPYVSATILKLIEQGKIQLDQPIEKLLSSKTAKLLADSSYNLQAITIKQLLSHKSGTRNYVTAHYLDFMRDNPKYAWTRDEQIALAAKEGKPHAAPDAEFQYNDTNYLLLTEIIETITRQPFYKAMRSLLNYKKLGLNDTWFAKLEAKPQQTAPMAHQYWNTYHLDTYNADPSWDLYGGGGMVATEKDMALFFQNLFNGNIIKDPKVLAKIHEDVPPKTAINYCLGIRKVVTAGFTGYEHGGGLGTDVVYIPDLNATVAVASLEAEHRPLALEISKEIVRQLSLLKQHKTGTGH